MTTHSNLTITSLSYLSKIILFSALGTTLFTSLNCKAQQLKENVAIQGHYAPKILKTDRVMQRPEKVVFNTTDTLPAFQLQGEPADFSPFILTMPPTLWGTTLEPINNTGYVKINIGSWLGADLSAGYKFLNSSTTISGIYLQHNSTSLWRPNSEVSSLFAKKAKRYIYNENIGAYASHDFGKSGVFNAEILWHFEYFNYFNTSLNPVPTQTLNDISLLAGWQKYKTTPPPGKWNSKAEFNWRSFNYRHFFEPHQATLFYESYSPTRENHLRLSGNVTSPEAANQLRVDANMNLLLYSNKNIQLQSEANCQETKNYGLITITPRWIYTQQKFKFKAGFNFDMSIDTPGSLTNEHYSFLHVSPAISLTLLNPKWTAGLEVNGGTRLNTMASAGDEILYSSPRILQQQPTFSPLDAKIKFGFGPFAGLAGEVFGGYAITLHSPLLGSFATSLSKGNCSIFSPWQNQGIDLHGTVLGCKLSYTPLSWLDIKAATTWTPQNYEFGYYNSYDRPRLISDITLYCSALKDFDFQLQYALRMGRSVYYNNSSSVYTKHALPNISNLNLYARYSFSRRFSMNLTGINLINHKTEFLPGLPDNGIEIYAGFQYLF